MPIRQNCKGLHLYNNMTQRPDIDITVDYKMSFPKKSRK